MKRINNIFSQIINIDNLRIADKNARKGKKHQYWIKKFDRNSEENLLKLQESLVNHTFTTSKYTHRIIYEPKERRLAKLPYYPDRIVHHAIIQVLESTWYSIFTSDSYACVKKKGILGINKKLRKILQTDKINTQYCLKLDIKKFYDNINHDILKSIIRKKIKDKEVLWLLDDIIDSHEGIPIGNYCSQFFANLYLSYFDHWIKEELHVKYYFRYCDDFILLSDDKKFLWECFWKIKEYLSTLKLELKRNYQVFKIAENNKSNGRGIDFVGFIFYRNQTLIRKSIKRKIIKKAKKIDLNNINEIKQNLCGWFGWLKYSNSVNLTRNIINKQYYDKKLLWRKTSSIRKNRKRKILLSLKYQATQFPNWKRRKTRLRSRSNYCICSS